MLRAKRKRQNKATKPEVAALSLSYTWCLWYMYEFCVGVIAFGAYREPVTAHSAQSMCVVVFNLDKES